jgi:hypothetical protein
MENEVSLASVVARSDPAAEPLLLLVLVGGFMVVCV